MVEVATALVEKNTNLTPIEILDIACESWRGCDAEFDDERSPDRPFGELLRKAFDPGTLYPLTEHDEDEEWELWYENVERPFKERYNFC